MSFLGRRYRFCDGTCQQGYRLQARELLTANTPARLTHNSPASESDDNDDELVSYVPMNFFGEQGICSNSNLRIDKDQTQLPVTNVLEQFQLGEGDRKRESNKIVENAERPLDDGRIHVSGDVFQWSCTPPPTHGPAHIKGTVDFLDKKKIIWTKKSPTTGKFKSALGKTKNYSMAATTEDVNQSLAMQKNLMVIGTSCETFSRKDRISCSMEN